MGKGTIVEHLLARDDRLWLSQSWTTRPPRPGEPAEAYRFVDRGAFEAAVAAGRFLEWVEFLGYLQGTPIPEPPEGADIVFEIEVQGARVVNQLAPQALLVFVEAPTPDHQRARLERRGDSAETVERRLKKSAEERAVALDMGYEIIVNDTVSRAVEAIERLIDADREKRSRRRRQG